jgi:hypothetical protein
MQWSSPLTVEGTRMNNSSRGRKFIGISTAALFSLSGLVTALPAQAALAATPAYLTFEDNDSLGNLATGTASDVRFTGGFGGTASNRATPIEGGEGKALELVKGWEVWSGVTLMDSATSNRRLTDGTYDEISFDYYSGADEDTPVMLKIEIPNGALAECIKTAEPGWNIITCDFSTIDGWSSSTEYTRMAFFPNWPNPTMTNDGEVYYLDNLSINGGEPATLPVRTKAVTVTGQAMVGKTLTAKTGVFTGTGVTKTYRWYVCAKSAGVATTSPSSLKCKAISGSAGNKSKLKVTSAHRGKFIRVLQTATNDAGSLKVYSKTTAKVK